jgi:hypothetical protein
LIDKVVTSTGDVYPTFYSTFTTMNGWGGQIHHAAVQSIDRYEDNRTTKSELHWHLLT